MQKGAFLCLCFAELLSLLFVVSCTADVPPTAPPPCDPVEGYYLPSGVDYRGHVNVTVSGIPCQAWNEQHPHHHDTPILDPLTGVGSHNYCRSPSGLERPGCFTINPSIRYQFCNVGPVCNYTPREPLLQVEPKTGSQLKPGQPVFISCYPRPCLIYYTLDGVVPSISTGKLYTHPVVIDRNTTINIIGLFASDVIRRRQAFFSLPDLAPAPALHFAPSSETTYNKPVLVVLEGIQKNDTTLIFRNNELHGSVYNGPFWLNESASITAVVNEKIRIYAHYNITVSVVPVVVYPPSGTFIGGVTCLVYQPGLHADYDMSVNGSDWQPMRELLFVVDTVGTNVLSVRATYLGGVQASVRLTYTVVAATPPTLSPPPEIVYNVPVQVKCADPRGRPMPLGVRAATNDNDNDDDDGAVYTIRFDRPGRFAVNCSYTDGLRRVWHSASAYVLQSVPLPAPLLHPDCGRRFPATPVRVDAKIVPPTANGDDKDNDSDDNDNDNDNDDNGHKDNGERESGRRKNILRLSLATLSTGAVLDPLPSGDPLRLSFALRPNCAPPVNATVSVVAHSVLPLEGASPRRACHYEFFPLGDAATPSFAGRPTRGAAPVLRHVADCLALHTTELVRGAEVGPFLVVDIVRLPEALRAEYYVRAGACMSTAPIADVRNETSGAIRLARRWAPAAAQPSVMTGAPLALRVDGWGLRRGAFHLARHEHGCDDIGVLPISRDGNDTAARLTFVVDTPGHYVLCAAIAEALYEVPPATGAAPLDVTPRPAAALRLLPCGGPMREGPMREGPMREGPVREGPMRKGPVREGPMREGPVREGPVREGPVREGPMGEGPVREGPVREGPVREGAAALAVVADIEPRALYRRVFAAADAGAWGVVPAGAAVAVRALSAAAPSAAVAFTAGARVAAAATCVFFFSSAPPPRVGYRWAVTARSGEAAAVLLAVNGSFAGDARVELRLCGPSETEAKTETETEKRTKTAANGGAGSTRVACGAFGSGGSPLLFTALATAGDAVAVADSVAALWGGPDARVLSVVAVVDGVAVTAEPTDIALSPLAIAMGPCSSCVSGWCLDGRCVCVGKTNHTAYMCGAEVPQTPTVSVGTRLVYFGIYLLIVALECIFVAVAVRYGMRRNALARERNAVVRAP